MSTGPPAPSRCSPRRPRGQPTGSRAALPCPPSAPAAPTLMSSWRSRRRLTLPGRPVVVQGPRGIAPPATAWVMPRLSLRVTALRGLEWWVLVGRSRGCCRVVVGRLWGVRRSGLLLFSVLILMWVCLMLVFRWLVVGCLSVGGLWWVGGVRGCLVVLVCWLGVGLLRVWLRVLRMWRVVVSRFCSPARGRSGWVWLLGCWILRRFLRSVWGCVVGFWSRWWVGRWRVCCVVLRVLRGWVGWMWCSLFCLR